MGFGYWVAEEKETGNFVGEIGFADYKRDIESLLKGVPESCSRIAGICGAIRKLAQLVTPLKKRLPIPAGVISSPGNFVRAVTRATASMAKSATVNSDTDPFDPSPHMSTV